MLDLEFVNGQASPMSSVALRFNVNTFGIMPEEMNASLTPPAAPGGGVGRASVKCKLSKENVSTGKPPSLQVEVAVRDNTSGAVLRFTAPFQLHALFVEDGEVPSKEFIATWSSLPAENELESTIANVVGSDLMDSDAGLPAVQRRLAARNVFYIAQRRLEDGQVVVYFSLKTATGLAVLVELSFKGGFDFCKACIKSAQPAAGPFVKAALEDIIVRK